MAATRVRSFHWTPGLVLGCVLLAAVVLVAVIAPLIWTASAAGMSERSAAPSAEHLLGTDAAGHDMLARTLVATRLTLLMTIGATAISVLIGIAVGTGVWLTPPRLRELCLRVIDGLVAFPALLLALVVAAVLGAGAGSAVIAIGIAGIPYFARLTANLASRVSRQDYISTARLFGVGDLQIARVHMIPNMAEPLLVLAASTFAQSLTAISALSFVGLGVQSPDYDWGKLLNDSLPSLLSGRAYQMVGPSVMIVVTGLAAMLIGDGLAAAANPRSAQARSTARTAPRAATGAGRVDTANIAEVRNLTISHGDRELVHGVSFSIRDGEILGIVGESGSGKTLTAMSLAKLLPEGLALSADRLAVDDVDLMARVDPGKLAQTISLVYQDPGTTFNPALRLGTQLTEVLRTHKKLSRVEARKQILSRLNLVQMTNPSLRLKQHPHELSGGMRQRAMIASALASEPRLIIADEPTTALDVTVQAEILREFKRINRVSSTAMMFISHDIGVVRALCDRVLVMYHGEIVEEIDARDLTVDGAKHPYTKALLAATPDLAPRGTTAITEPSTGATNV